MFGDNLKRIRKEKMFTQSKLGEIVGVSGAYIQQLEKGIKKNPSIEVLYKIIETLDIEVDDLLTPLEEKAIYEDALTNKKVSLDETKDIMDKIQKKSEIKLAKKLGIPPSDFFSDDFDILAKHMGEESKKINDALHSLYLALYYHYGDAITQNSQDEIFINLTTNEKEIYYTKEEFKNFLEYVALSFPNFKYTTERIKNKEEK